MRWQDNRVCPHCKKFISLKIGRPKKIDDVTEEQIFKDRFISAMTLVQIATKHRVSVSMVYKLLNGKRP